MDESLLEALKKQVFTYTEINEKLHKLGYSREDIYKILLGIINNRYNG
jgi:hypothetical protein